MCAGPGRVELANSKRDERKAQVIGVLCVSAGWCSLAGWRSLAHPRLRARLQIVKVFSQDFSMGKSTGDLLMAGPPS